MELIEIGEYFINLKQIKLVKKLKGGKIFISTGEQSGVSLEGEEAEQFLKLLQWKSKTIEKALKN